MRAFYNFIYFRSWKTARCDEANAKYYDATFDHHSDVFYCHINEIDPILDDGLFDDVQEEEDDEFIYVDPRNGKRADIAEISVEEPFKPQRLYNRFPSKSTLTPVEHDVCLKALAALKKGESSSSKEVIEKYKSLKEKIREENQKYSDFVKDYFMSNNMYRKKEVDPDIFEMFADKWRAEVDDFKKKQTIMLAHNYVLATAIPLKFDVSQVKEFTIKLSDESPSKPTTRALFPLDIVHNRIKAVPFHLERYYEDYQLEKPLDDNVPENIDVSLSIMSLLSLMQGFYDESDDWMVPIVITDDGLRKQILFDKHLPTAKLGSICRNNSIALDVVRAIFVQRTGNNLGSPNETWELIYDVKTFDQFLEEYTQKVNEKGLRQHQEVQNRFEISTEDDNLSLLVSCLPDAVDKDSLVIFSPKLEYQPEFGEEQMTQYELVREWVYLRFAKNTLVKRIRMDSSTYAIFSIKDITLPIVTSELNRLYQIQENELLHSLFQLITMLKGFPPAIYLGRHDPAKKERILIYQHHPHKPTDTANAHLDLKNVYSDVNFSGCQLDELEWTPIDTEGITDVHLQSRVAPGLFPFHAKYVKRQIKEFKKIPKKLVTKPFDKKKNASLSKKKNKNKKNKAIRKKKQMLLKSFDASESCDPTQLFDESGNVNIMSMLHLGCSKSEETPKESVEKVVNEPTQEQPPIDKGKVKKRLPSTNKRIVLRNREILVPPKK